MPIVDVEVVTASLSDFSPPPTQRLADELGKVFRSPEGNTWVRFRLVDSSSYAENQSTLSSAELPVFVTVLHARPPSGEALALEAQAITAAVSSCLARAEQRVHVQYAPAALGRQAFGGNLLQ